MDKKITGLKLFLLLFWQVSFAQQTILTDSNLPIMVISTDIDPATNLPIDIPDEPKVLATMQLIYRPDGARNYLTDITNDSFLNYNGRMGIELRGSSSQELDKKPYGFTTLLEDDDSNNNVSLLGMPSENDWVLNSLAYDPSMIRDYLSYTLASNMGNYAPRVKYIEVIVNDDYKGVYILTEKIKRDSDRVNLKKIDDEDTDFPEVTGGYIVKADKTTGGDVVAWTMPNYGGWDTDFLHHYPKTEDITTEQAAYIETVFRDLETQTNLANASIINGYPSIIDIPSFVDYIIVAEIASNPDSYQFSTFFHKDRGGKLRAGPVWDYNLSYGNDLFVFGFDRSFYDVWQFEYENMGAKFWKDLFQDSTFKCYLSKRFDELTKPNMPLNYEYIFDLIDNTSELISEALVRENDRWNTIDDFPEEIATMKIWIQERIAWMRDNLGSFSNCNTVEVPSLVITKIDYNPQETATFPESDDLEFIEIQNTGNSIINLTGIYLVKLGLSYQFPKNSSLDAGKSIYLASNETTFLAKYGVAPFDIFIRNLSNKKHNLLLSDAYGNIIDEVEYLDTSPWPESADGDGFYLELINVNSDNALASNWTASSNLVLTTNTFSTNEIDLKVYTNLTEEELIINSKQTIQKITIFNLLGQQIKKFQVNFKTGEIPIRELKKGVYFLNLKFTNSLNVTTKILKK